MSKGVNFHYSSGNQKDKAGRCICQLSLFIAARESADHHGWLAKNPRYTQRFALQVGKLCRDMPNKAVAELERTLKLR